MPRRWWRGAVLACVGALLAGCGGSPEASPAPSPAASASASEGTSESPSVSPTPAPPERPAAVDRRNERGAVAALHAYVDSLNYAAATGDVEPLRDSFIDFCTRCAAVADDIAETYRAGGSFEGGEWSLVDTKSYGVRDAAIAIDAVIDYEPQRWISSAEAEPVDYPGVDGRQHAFQLAFSASGGWRVAALDPDS